LKKINLWAIQKNEFFFYWGKRINFWAAPGRLESPFYSLAPPFIAPVIKAKIDNCFPLIKLYSPETAPKPLLQKKNQL